MNGLCHTSPRLGATRHALHVSASLVSLSLVACVSAAPSTEAGVAEVELPEAQHADRAQVASAEPRARPLRGGPDTGFSLGELATPPVGSACTPTQSESALDTCGTMGRVALQLLFGQPHLSTPADPPCAPQTMKSSGVYLVAACIADEHLYLREVCIACRLPNMGSVVYARLDELGPAQHAHLGKLFHADQATPTKAAEWKPFLASMAKPDGAPGP